MKEISAGDLAGDADHWLAEVVIANEPVLVRDAHGNEVVMIPADWWVPAAAAPPPEPLEPDEWEE